MNFIFLFFLVNLPGRCILGSVSWWQKCPSMWRSLPFCVWLKRPDRWFVPGPLLRGLVRWISRRPIDFEPFYCVSSLMVVDVDKIDLRLLYWPFRDSLLLVSNLCCVFYWKHIKYINSIIIMILIADRKYII